MDQTRPKVLVISDLFPNPARPVDGIFVKYQCDFIKPYATQVVVSPYRVFPHLQLWKNITQPQKTRLAWLKWLAEMNQIPQSSKIDDLPVYYPRYTSPPRQIFHSLWGYFAYASIKPLLKQLHQIYRFDLIHAHYASPAGLIGLLAQRWMHRPMVVSVHGADLTYTLHQKPLGNRIVPWVLTHANAVLANSTETARKLREVGVKENRLHLVRLGVNLPEIRPSPIQKTNHCTYLLSVGYLNKRKGHIFVLQAVAELVQKGYDLHYTIIGDGTETATLQAFVRQNGLNERVTFTGYLPHEQVWPYFSACDMFVLPSWNEAFGLVYIEALSMGKPAIGCVGEGGPEDLRSLGDCIELVQPRDVDSLRSAIQNLTDNPARRAVMGELGGKIVSQYYTWEKTADHTAKIYSHVLGNQPLV